jgi:hypothetical protein
MAVVPSEIRDRTTGFKEATETDGELAKAGRKNFGKVFVRWHPLGRNVKFGVVVGGGLDWAFSTEETADAEAALQVGGTRSFLGEVGKGCRLEWRWDKLEAKA